jgi:hypothetical protein
MAKNIDYNLGLVLEGQDAIDFKNYIANTEYSPRCRELLEKAWAMHLADVENEKPTIISMSKS